MLSLTLTITIRCQYEHAEHLNRQKYGVGYEMTSLGPKTLVPQGYKAFKCYLANAKTKVHLTAFLRKELISISKNTLDHGQTFSISYECEGRIISVKQTQ